MKVLVLAGGFDQIALIKELKKRGAFVILADYYENPPAKLYADKHYQISTLDEEAVYDLAIMEKVDLITTACTDQALLTVARVSEKLKLPTYLSAETAQNVTNKAFMKKQFIKNDIPTAAAIILEDYTTWKKDIQKISDFPVVVKPCDCNSSKGVVRVDEKDTLEKAVEEAFSLSRSKKVIIEQFISGREISVDVWVEESSVRLLSVSETIKIPNDDNSFTICQSKYPVEDIGRYKSQIVDIANNIARSFALKNCPMLIQALINGDNIYVIEFSARMGGGTKYKLINQISGLDIMKIYVNRILGNIEQNVHPELTDKFIEIDYLYTANGTVTDLVGFDECKKEGSISDFFQYKMPGSVITAHKTSSDRIAGILLIGENPSELDNQRKFVLSKIDILDHGKSILYRDCFNYL